MKLFRKGEMWKDSKIQNVFRVLRILNLFFLFNSRRNPRLLANHLILLLRYHSIGDIDYKIFFLPK